MLSQRYDLRFYVSFKLEKRQNPAISWLNEKTKKIIEKEMELKLVRPIFGRKITPDIANPVLEKFRKLLESFKFEDEQVRVVMRDTYPLENFFVQEKENYLIGQYLLHFDVLNKHKGTQADNFSFVQPLLLKKIKKLKIEEDGVILKITDFRVFGEVLQNPENWPHDASTEF